MAKQISLKDILEKGINDEALKTLTFEQGLALLDELVLKVESGNLALDNSIQAYEHGVKLILRLRELLSGAEEKLRTLQIESSAKKK